MGSKNIEEIKTFYKPPGGGSTKTMERQVMISGLNKLDKLKVGTL